MSFIKCEVFLPKDYEKKLIDALNAHEILKFNQYDSVYAATEVTGHWRPLEGADPYDGTIGKLSTAKEIKLEFRIPVYERMRVERIIREVHPYEEPVINFLELL